MKISIGSVKFVKFYFIIEWISYYQFMNYLTFITFLPQSSKSMLKAREVDGWHMLNIIINSFYFHNLYFHSAEAGFVRNRAGVSY